MSKSLSDETIVAALECIQELAAGEITRLRRERDQLREALERLWAFREIGPSEWAWNEARRILDATTPEEASPE